MASIFSKFASRLGVPPLVVMTSLSAALWSSPSAAASGLTFGAERLGGGTLAAVIVVGALLFAIVFEACRLTMRKPVPIRDRATHDWTPRRQDH